MSATVEFSRKFLKDIPPDKIIDRADLIKQVITIIEKINTEARNIRSSSPQDTNAIRHRLIAITGGEGVGKSIFLENLEKELKDKNLATTKKILLNDYIDLCDKSDQKIHELLKEIEKSVVGELSPQAKTFSDLPSHVSSMSENLRISQSAVVVLIDNLESLNNPQYITEEDDADKAKVYFEQVAKIKKYILRPLLRLFDVPVIIIAAIRAMPKSTFPYLSEIDFQDALYEIELKNTESDIKKVASIDSQDLIDKWGGALLVADHWPQDWEKMGSEKKEKILQDLINHLMKDKKPFMAVFERLATKNEKFTGGEIREIMSDVDAQYKPFFLSRLLATSFVSLDPTSNPKSRKYYMYPPLRYLLQESNKIKHNLP